MPLALFNGKTLFFAHVPKTGGSSVEDYLIRRFGPLSIRERARDAGRRRDLIQSASHLAAADLELLLPARLDYCFAVVRDPAARLISEYGFQKGQSLTSRLGFSVWLRVMLRAARRDPRVYENHIRRQTDLVPEGTEVFRLEDGLDTLVARLDAVTGTAAPEVEMCHLLKRAKIPVGLARQDVELILAFYAADYERFDYPRPDPQDYPGDPLAPLRDLAAMALAPLVVARHHRRWLR